MRAQRPTKAAIAYDLRRIDNLRMLNKRAERYAQYMVLWVGVMNAFARERIRKAKVRRKR